MISSPRAALLTVYGTLCWSVFVVMALSALALTLPLPTVTLRRHITRGTARLFLGAAGFRLKVTGIIKKEMVTVPLAGFLLRRLGSEFVERHDRHRAAGDARRVLRRAAGGEALACFPEGTFSRHPGVHRFHAGAFVAASRAGLEVVPAVIRGTRGILPDGRRLPLPGRIEVELLGRLSAAGDGETDAAVRLRQQSRRMIIDSLGEPDLEHRHTKPA